MSGRKLHGLIYNSRNYLSLIDINGVFINLMIYNSRNYLSLIDKEQRIYNGSTSTKVEIT